MGRNIMRKVLILFILFCSCNMTKADNYIGLEAGLSQVQLSVCNDCVYSSYSYGMFEFTHTFLIGMRFKIKQISLIPVGGFNDKANWVFGGTALFPLSGKVYFKPTFTNKFITYGFMVKL